MNQKNYTPIDNLIEKLKKEKKTSISIGKESQPVPLTKEKSIEIKEAVEYEPDAETYPFVQKSHDTIVLPPDLQKLGLQPATTSQFSNYQNIKLPITDDQIVAGLHAPVTSSLRWLATFALYLLRKAHLGLKIIHGHAVRILRRI
ncbi:MAG: hypothetical protein US11_C0007G0026 [Candidatus Roizmanbacteria bacterium GW2011_GWA2_36_23]|uniref:Uncharacterized protein n=1 Tax=Candidatus Roizmanbacteria bacterium GW2011_GWA2_36_23 TaxID=1618480 RepID=A0A0G0E3P4_9BACT|nr:MAG: hypothetical protein US11_C0007G0026 [Candidatus Roizmanbacteria bacterium GW2011_GWA2_36_23]